MGLRRSVAFALAGIALACTACGSTGPQASSSTTTTATSQITLNRNGTVTVAVPNLPTNFNPATVAGSTPVTAMIMSSVLPQTFVLNNLNAPQCPESVSNVCDGLLSGTDPAELVSTAPQTVIYHIAARAVWSDGVPITVADFTYNWKMQLEIGSSLPATDPIYGYRDISSITGSNAGKTVTVVFTKPYADWQALFTNLIPAHIGKDLAGWVNKFSKFDTHDVLSGGPFSITKFTPGHELILSRNPRFWGPAAGVSKIIFRVERTQRAALRALSSGLVDMASLIPSPQVDNTVVASTNLLESTQPGPIMYQLDFNLADPTMSNLDLRIAISEAIDRHQIVSDTVGTLTPTNNVASNHLFPYGLQGSQPNDSTFEPTNLTQAATQLTEAGYTIGPDGIARSVIGQPLVLSLIGPNGNKVVSEIEAEIQAQLLQLGIEVSIENVSSNNLLADRLPQGTYQLAIAPYLMSQFLSTDVQLYTDPVGPVFGSVSSTGTTIPLSSSGNAVATGSGTESAATNAGAVTRDVFGYVDPNVTQLFADASKELGAGANTTYNQIDTAIWAGLPALPLFQMPVAFVSNARVLNVTNSQGWVGPMWNAQNWTVQSSPTPTTTTTLPG